MGQQQSVLEEGREGAPVKIRSTGDRPSVRPIAAEEIFCSRPCRSLQSKRQIQLSLYSFSSVTVALLYWDRKSVQRNNGAPV